MEGKQERKIELQSPSAKRTKWSRDHLEECARGVQRVGAVQVLAGLRAFEPGSRGHLCWGLCGRGSVQHDAACSMHACMHVCMRARVCADGCARSPDSWMPSARTLRG
jgi:hypothetical protein